MAFFTENEIRTNAKTVENLAGYFKELRQKADELADTATTLDRGYFSAEEDDQTRQLLVSYWHSRNALFDLILEFRRKISNFREADANEFLVPFSAALLLVDAARFLREYAEGRPIIRRKLNEPAPTFGIPGGTYDTVQKSLVSTRHAWHLYYALRLYEERSEELKKAAEESSLAFLVDITEELKHRLDISLARFAQVKLRTRGDRWMRNLGRATFSRAMYGFQKLAASMMADVYVRPGHQPRIPDSIGQQIQNHLMPGDVILVRKEYALTNYFLPGYWPHVALYLGSIDELRQLNVKNINAACWNRLCDDRVQNRVLESMKDGVFFRPLESPLSSDSLVVIRPRISTSMLSAAIERGTSHEGKPYDFDFDFRRSDRLVCTEVIYRAYDGIGPIHFDLVNRAGRPTLSGNDLITISLKREQFEPVAAYVPTLQSEIESNPNRLVALIERATV